MFSTMGENTKADMELSSYILDPLIETISQMLQIGKKYVVESHSTNKNVIETIEVVAYNDNNSIHIDTSFILKFDFDYDDMNERIQSIEQSITKIGGCFAFSQLPEYGFKIMFVFPS